MFPTKIYKLFRYASKIPGNKKNKFIFTKMYFVLILYVSLIYQIKGRYSKGSERVDSVVQLRQLVARLRPILYFPIYKIKKK